MVDTCISYSHHGITYAKITYLFLQMRILKTVIDRQEISPSTNWNKEIQVAAGLADNFAFNIGLISVNFKVCGHKFAHIEKCLKLNFPTVTC